jgi:hypothetical protein
MSQTNDDNHDGASCASLPFLTENVLFLYRHFEGRVGDTKYAQIQRELQTVGLERAKTPPREQRVSCNMCFFLKCSKELKEAPMQKV